MEEVHKTLTLQVKTWLEKNKLENADPQMVYRHFIGQCDQFGISEGQFYTEILRPAYRDAHFDATEDPDPKNDKHTHVIIFGERLHSLKRLGQVLFNNQQQSVAYFEDVTLIKSHVDTLASGDDALAYAKLYKEEGNPEKRYLKIIYHLNPKLPYRIGTRTFNTIEELIEKAFEDQSLYSQFYNEYVLGKLSIWLQEADPERAAASVGGRSYNAFLRFIYQINVDYPFYMGTDLYAKPHELVVKAQKSIAFRKQLYEHVVNEQLFTWFDCIGFSDWQVQYLPMADRLAQKKLTGDDLIHASIQKLIRIMDVGIHAPKFKASETALSYTQLEASKLLVVPVKLSLVNTGYLNIQIMKDANFEGISLDQSEATFFDLGDLREFTFNLIVNPLVIMKDKRYQFNIQILTDYEQLNIPVEVKAIFPLKTFVTYLVKYAAIFFVAFAGFRFALQSFAKNQSWLNSGLIVDDLEGSLPRDYGIYIFFLIVFLALGLATYPLIRKIEKI